MYNKYVTKSPAKYQGSISGLPQFNYQGVQRLAKHSNIMIEHSHTELLKPTNINQFYVATFVLQENT